MDIEFKSDAECLEYISGLFKAGDMAKLQILLTRNDMDVNMHIEEIPLLAKCIYAGCTKCFDVLISRTDLIWSRELVLSLYGFTSQYETYLRKITDVTGIPFPHLLDIKADEAKRVYVPWRFGYYTVLYGGFAKIKSSQHKEANVLIVRYDDGDVREYDVRTKRMIDDSDLAVINDHLSLRGQEFVKWSRIPATYI